MKTWVILITLLLIGCGHSPVVIPTPGLPSTPTTNQPVEKPKQTVELDAELLKPCPPPSKLTNNNPTPEDVLEQHAKDVSAYSSCARHLDALIVQVKKAFNIKN